VRSIPTRLSGPLLVEPTVHGDERGFFVETFRRSFFQEHGLEHVDFVQDNHSRSRRGVVRGMHFQIGDGIGKLVRCARGEIVDVVVDVRRGSPDFGRWEAFTLNDGNHHQVWVPAGFAHGFCVMSEIADVVYKQTGYYDPALERGIAYDDPEVAIEWPLPREQLVASARDAAAPRLSELADEQLFRYGA
jgi:dTDP-4-dehydrorhamnose 3,5-epimerase